MHAKIQLFLKLFFMKTGLIHNSQAPKVIDKFAFSWK